MRGLTMAAISGTFNMCDPVESHIEHNLRRLDVLADACRWLDTRIITLCSGTRHGEDMWSWHAENVRKAAWERLLETMREAVKIADRHEVTLAFEPEVHNVVSSVMRARRLLDEIASPWLKVVIDPVNLFYKGNVRRLYELLDEAFDWLGADIVLAHAKEPPALDKAFAISARELSAIIERVARGERGEILPAHLGQAFEGDDMDQQRFAGWAAFHFPYIVRLWELGFRGPLIMHGVEEPKVDETAALLRRLLGHFADPETRAGLQTD